MVIRILSRIIPTGIKRRIPMVLRSKLIRILFREKKSPTYRYLENLMLKYQTKNLVNVGPESFKNRIDKFLQLIDYKMEAFADAEKQRDLSVKFYWGHNHDFGDFYLEGKMMNRHFSLITTFIDEFSAIPKSLDGLRVLDIGCWTGGTSLLLCAMGAHVVAIEEVKKYVDCLNYLKHAFDIGNLEPKNLSLYECVTPDFQDSFDIVLFAGVLYHVTDPVLALRIMFNCLKDGGLCLLETNAINSNKPVLSYEGPSKFWGGSQKDLSRHGWNWFLPSPKALHQMMADVGYKDISINKVISGRVFAVGKRREHLDMMRGGLSVRGIY